MCEIHFLTTIGVIATSFVQRVTLTTLLLKINDKKW